MSVFGLCIRCVPECVVCLSRVRVGAAIAGDPRRTHGPLVCWETENQFSSLPLFLVFFKDQVPLSPSPSILYTLALLCVGMGPRAAPALANLLPFLLTDYPCLSLSLFPTYLIFSSVTHMKLNVYITEFSFDFIRAHTKYKDALFSVRVSYQDVPSWLTLVGLLKEKKYKYLVLYILIKKQRKKYLLIKRRKAE